MKKRNIGLCVVATTLFMGSHAQATELVLAKDHTNVVNQAAEIAAYKSNRPPVNQRLFKSKAVEAEIIRVKKLLTNQKLAWMFENCFPNTLETTVHYRTTDGKPDTFVYTGDIHAMWLRDSGAQVWPYIQLANKDPELKKMLEGVIRRQFKCINIDPYAKLPSSTKANIGSVRLSAATNTKPLLLAKLTTYINVSKSIEELVSCDRVPVKLFLNTPMSEISLPKGAPPFLVCVSTPVMSIKS